MGSTSRRIEQAYYFDASPEKMFKYFTSRKKLVKWFLSDAEITPKAGSKYKFTWSGGSSQAGVVEKVVPNKSLILTWPNVVKGKEYRTQATFTFTKKGKGTLVGIRHVGFEDGDDWRWLYGAVQSGWAYFMMNLKSVVTNGEDLRSKHDSP